MTTTTLWLIVVAICGTGWLVCHWLNRRATKTINVDDEAAGDCLDCAQDQAIGITRDGSHDRTHLSMCERITFEQLEREYQREAS